MELEPQDQDIVGLLTKLKNVNEGYPADMLAARRQSYLNHMAELGLGVGLATGLKEVAKNASTPTVPSGTSTLLEVALAVAILAEASTVAYFYRDKIADFFQRNNNDSRAQEITPVSPSSLEIQGTALTPSPAITTIVPFTATLPTVSSTAIIVTVGSTPIPGVADDNDNNDAGAVNQMNSTPAPNRDNDDSGNHYGQTPKPERTKESGNSDTGSSKDNDSPPQENNSQNPKDNSKPPKTK